MTATTTSRTLPQRSGAFEITRATNVGVPAYGAGELPGIGKSTAYAGKQLVHPVTVAAGEPLPHDCVSCCWRQLPGGARSVKFVSANCPAHGDLPWTPWQPLKVGRGHYRKPRPVATPLEDQPGAWRNGLPRTDITDDQIIRLRDVEKLQWQAIADATSMSVAGVTERYRRAMAA